MPCHAVIMIVVVGLAARPSTNTRHRSTALRESPMLAAQQRFPHYRHEVPATGKSIAMVSWFKPRNPAAAATDTAASARDALLNRGLDLAM